MGDIVERLLALDEETFYSLPLTCEAAVKDAAVEVRALRARVAVLEAEKAALVERIVEAVKREGCGSCTAYGEWERCVRGAALGDGHG